eukprot:GHRR01001911.1.p1 GENE.GHRR01001911.1~~GHRR01001911.1.p1  ORF type:complete len:730 (+),score=353.40 GHRR01001911.1:370-2559(+)
MLVCKQFRCSLACGYGRSSQHGSRSHTCRARQKARLQAAGSGTEGKAVQQSSNAQGLGQQQHGNPHLKQQANSTDGYASLLLVSALWGSYTPALRYLYSMDSLLTPQVLTAHRTVISAAALLAASAVSLAYGKYTQHMRQQQKTQLHQQPRVQQVSSHSSGSSSSSSDSSSGRELIKQPTSRSSSGLTGDAANAAAVLTAGLELGIWNFLGTSSQAIGVELSTATKAAFLMQTTAVFTPCLAVLCGQAVLPAHWLGCLAAVVGSCCITLDSLVSHQQLFTPEATATAASAVYTVLPANSSASISRSNSSSQLDRESTVIETAAALLASQQPNKTMLPAPALQDPLQNSTRMLATNNRLQSQAADDTSAVQRLRSIAGTIQRTTSTNSGSSSGAARANYAASAPLLTCSPTAASPQGVVHSIACVPLLPAPTLAATSSAQLDSGVGSSSGSNSPNSSEVSRVQAVVSSHVLVPAVSSQARVQQQQQQQTSGNRVLSVTTQSSDISWPVAVPRRSRNITSSSNSDYSSHSQHQQDAYSTPASASTLQDSSSVADASSSSDSNCVAVGSSGELYILLACCCYAIATVRLSMLAPGLDPVQLATSKTLTLAVASLCWLLTFQFGTTAAAGTAGVSTWHLPSAFAHGPGLLLLVYSALGPGALATVLQAHGQAVLTAAQAQVLYSLTPLCAALLAGIFLQGEEMGPLAWIGGSIIIAASVVAAANDASNNSKRQ